MPVNFLSEAERERFNSFPADLSTGDLIAFFTPSESDLMQIPTTTTAANRLGFALRILLLRFLSFHLTDLTSVPTALTDYVGSQIGADTEQIEFYAERGATRTVHQRAIEDYLGFRLPTEEDFQSIGKRLLERALEHDRPTLLLQLLCERFPDEKLVRPGFSVVERMVGAARNALTKAIQEYGKLNETIFILKYLQCPEYQKKITVQLNKGEAIHALRRDVFVANEGKIRQRHPEEQLNQAACLNLVVNAVTVWNTVYMQSVLEQLKNDNEDDVKHLSPARSEHINMYGKYYFNIEEGLKRKGLRELRKPESDFPWG